MACLADQESYAFSAGHQPYPRRPLEPSWLVEVGKFADVVDLQPDPRLAELALSGWRRRWVAAHLPIRRPHPLTAYAIRDTG